MEIFLNSFSKTQYYHILYKMLFAFKKSPLCKYFQLHQLLYYFNLITNTLQSTITAANRIFRLIDEQPELKDVKDAEILSDVHGNIKMDHVYFGYNQEKNIIHDFNFKANDCDLVAIVGPIGAGKTTIINLLMRFYDPNNGIISVKCH